jgi:hypothetical protein
MAGNVEDERRDQKDRRRAAKNALKIDNRVSNAMKPVVFIHTPSKHFISARVCAYSLRTRSRHPDSFEIRFLSLEETPELLQHEGGSFRWRDGARAVRWHADMPQAFVLLRLRVPELMQFEGRALLLDPDIIAIGDVWELLSRDMKGKAVFCRPWVEMGEGFSTSVALMECSQLRHWQWREQIEEVFRRERPVRSWLSLIGEDPDTIGCLEEEWNDCDRLTEKTRLLHYTNRRTQPWLTGLPYHGHYIRPNSVASKAAAFLRLAGLHRPHPHAEAFLALLREAVECEEITKQEIHQQIRLGLLRPDALAWFSR